MAGESVAVGLDIGVVDIDVHPGAHICGMYRGAAERDDLLVAFLNAGLAAGDKCICVIDAGEPSEIIAGLGAELAARGRADEKQLDVIRASDMHLRSGRFSPDETIGSWKAAISEVMYDGRFDMVRAVETWSLRDVVPDARELVALDSEMNRFLPLFPQVILCLYDLEGVGGDSVVDLLRTHPKVLVGKMVLENPYYLGPDEFLAVAQSRADDRHGLEEWAAHVAL